MGRKEAKQVGQDSVIWKCSGQQDKGLGPSPAQSQVGPVRTVDAGAETQPVAAGVATGQETDLCPTRGLVSRGGQTGGQAAGHRTCYSA